LGTHGQIFARPRLLDGRFALIFNCRDPRRPLGGKSAVMGRNAMDLITIIILLLIGAIAGWLAGLIVKGIGFGLIGNIIVGIVGAFLSNLLLPQLGIFIGAGIIASIINATIGAVILLVIIGFVKRA
jgi:uncharacterized membrane protein YeaQ/YmgE (transglycosylase-associated protein family)